MTRMRTASQSAKKKRNRRVKGAIRAAAAQPPTSHSPAGESDNMPPSGSKRPRPKKPASTKKKARGKQIFLESDDPLEKNVVDKSAIPDGYVFVAKGDVYVTRKCRVETKESNRMVYTVWDKAGKRSFGIRVPSEIHSQVLKMAASTSEARAKAVRTVDAKTLSRGRQLLRQQFPRMPEDSLEEIVSHAFLKGSGRVGRTSRVTDKKKAELAVEAHIRHTHTMYDTLLGNGVGRSDARGQVWSRVQAMKKEWEGDGERKNEVTKADGDERGKSLPVDAISISSGPSRASSIESESAESLQSWQSVESVESLVWL